MAKEAEVLAAINRKSKDTRADCYVMTTPQDTSEKHLLKGIQARPTPTSIRKSSKECQQALHEAADIWGVRQVRIDRWGTRFFRCWTNGG